MRKGVHSAMLPMDLTRARQLKPIGAEGYGEERLSLGKTNFPPRKSVHEVSKVSIHGVI